MSTEYILGPWENTINVSERDLTLSLLKDNLILESPWESCQLFSLTPSFPIRNYGYAYIVARHLGDGSGDLLWAGVDVDEQY